MVKKTRGRNMVSTRHVLRLETLESRRLLAGDLPGGAGLESFDLTPFQSTDELEKFLVEDALERYEGLFGQPGWSGPLWRTWDGILEQVAAPPAVGDAALDHSDTNTQVAGVDEGDIVETDGRYLYILSGQEVVIAQASPSDQLQVSSRVPIDGQPFAEFFLFNRSRHVPGGGHSVIHDLLDGSHGQNGSQRGVQQLIEKSFAPCVLWIHLFCQRRIEPLLGGVIVIKSPVPFQGDCAVRQTFANASTVAGAGDID